MVRWVLLVLLSSSLAYGDPISLTEGVPFTPPKSGAFVSDADAAYVKLKYDICVTTNIALRSAYERMDQEEKPNNALYYLLAGIAGFVIGGSVIAIYK